ncbi:MAG: ferredoxin, partial [Oscillospiraceae bacterium]|nr:ferredoxin [Oscillospiraceae bacterium]
GVDYTEKLACIIAANDIERITVVRMQVPCCGGLENAVRRAVHASGKDVPLRVVTLSSEGETVSSI